MRVFKINAEQWQKIMNILAECPAKYAFHVIDILRNLEEIMDQPEKENQKMN